MQFLNKLERKIGKFAISNLTLYIIITYVVGYAIYLYCAYSMGIDSRVFLCLSPELIFEYGQAWRIISWIFIPPSAPSIWVIIMLFFYYSIGNAVERTWGEFKYNLYIFSGIFFTIIGSFILYGMEYLGWIPIGSSTSFDFSTKYISMSIFLAFATVFPNQQVLLFFLIPVKMKWLAYIDGALILMDFVSSGLAGRVVIVMSLLNFLLFFFGTRDYKHISPREIHRRQEYKKQTVHMTSPGITKHKCAICGRTEKDGDMLEFRFCSKCNGNYEYCQDHLFSHEHVH